MPYNVPENCDFARWNPPETMPTGKIIRVLTVTGMVRKAITYVKDVDKRGFRECYSRESGGRHNSFLKAVGWLPLED